jgi:gliding motility-associated-like protein
MSAVYRVGMHHSFIINPAINRNKLLGFLCLLFLFLEHDALAQLQRSAPKIHMSDTLQFCPNAETVIHIDSITGGFPPYQFRWNLNDELAGTQDSAIVLLTDTTHIFLSVYDAEGRITRDSLLALPYSAIDASFESNAWEGCAPLEIIYTSNYLAFQHVSTMDWNYGNGSVDRQLASAIELYEEPGIYFPWLEITDEHGCIWMDTLLNGIRVFPTPHARFSVLEEQLYLPETTLLVDNLSDGAENFTWYYSGGTAISGFEPNIEFPKSEGMYELNLEAKNEFGCSHTTSKVIEVVQAIDLWIPNAFTPDGDGINDTWKIQGPGMDAHHMSLEIYDPWGTIVFTTNNPDEVWTGLSADGITSLKPGNYNYRIIARDTEHGVGHLFEGHVFLLR